MQWLHYLTRTALLALLIYPVAASGQGTAPAPSPAPATPSAPPEARTPPPPAASTGPSFQSGGIKATVASITGKDHGVAVSLLLENKTTENLLVAVIGPPLGVNGGNSYGPVAIGGISSCIYNPHNDVVKSLDRTFEISGCLKGDKPQLTPDAFTLIDAGNAVPMNVAFSGLAPLDPNKDFAFSMNVAVFKESDLNSSEENGGALAAKDRSPTLPKSLRYISIGIASLPLNRR